MADAIKAAPEAKDGPALIAELIERALALAGENADASARREALLSVLGAWELDAHEMALCADGHDVPGSAYEALLSGAERRAAGQFATPHYAADLMAAWLLREPVELLLDPGVGSGRLLYRAALHERAAERLLGLDTDPLAVDLAQRNLAWRGLERSEVRVADFFSELPEHPDAVICNPSYARHHALPADMKAAIHDGFERRLGVKFSRLAALHALFLVRTVEVCAPGARIAFITPGDWLDTAYGRAIKKWILSQAQVEGIVLFPEDALVFGGSVMSSAAITFLRKHDDGAFARAGASPGKTRVVRLPHDPVPVERVLAALTSDGSYGLSTKEVELTASGKWSRPTPKSNGGTPLSELARVRRGIATGCNSFFVLSEATRREWGLPLDELRPCASSPRAVKGLEVMSLEGLADNAPRWVLACWRPEAEHEHSPLGAYLRRGRELGIPDGYLASKRKPWHGLDKRQPPDILWPYFNRARLRFVRNHARALPLNSWLGIEPHEHVDADVLWRLLNEPTTLQAFLACRRSYAGMSKLEPSELSEVRVPWRW